MSKVTNIFRSKTQLKQPQKARLLPLSTLVKEIVVRHRLEIGVQGPSSSSSRFHYEVYSKRRKHWVMGKRYLELSNAGQGVILPVLVSVLVHSVVQRSPYWLSLL